MTGDPAHDAGDIPVRETMIETEILSESAPGLVAQLRGSLLRRAGEYAKLTNLKLGTVSDRCAGDGKFLKDVEAGKNFTVDRYQAAMNWLDAHWPEDMKAAS